MDRAKENASTRSLGTAVLAAQGSSCQRRAVSASMLTSAQRIKTPVVTTGLARFDHYISQKLLLSLQAFLLGDFMEAN